MPLVKTSELIGVALDWAVAKADGREEIRVFAKTRPTDLGWIEIRFNPEPRANTARYDPSIDWGFGGPIIERERITLDARESDWQARIWNDVRNDYIEVGRRGGYCTTALVAAMRCYVTSKLGEEVDIPEELM